jgi:hypothetical protein
MAWMGSDLGDGWRWMVEWTVQKGRARLVGQEVAPGSSSSHAWTGVACNVLHLGRASCVVPLPSTGPVFMVLDTGLLQYAAFIVLLPSGQMLSWLNFQPPTGTPQFPMHSGRAPGYPGLSLLMCTFGVFDAGRKKER